MLMWRSGHFILALNDNNHDFKKLFSIILLYENMIV